MVWSESYVDSLAKKNISGYSQCVQINAQARAVFAWGPLVPNTGTGFRYSVHETVQSDRLYWEFASYALYFMLGRSS